MQSIRNSKYLQQNFCYCLSPWCFELGTPSKAELIGCCPASTATFHTGKHFANISLGFPNLPFRLVLGLEFFEDRNHHFILIKNKLPNTSRYFLWAGIPENPNSQHQLKIFNSVSIAWENPVFRDRSCSYNTPLSLLKLEHFAWSSNLCITFIPSNIPVV